MIASVTSDDPDARTDADLINEEAADDMLAYEREKDTEENLLEDYNKKLQEIEEKEAEIELLENAAAIAKANAETAYNASVDSE